MPVEVVRETEFIQEVRRKGGSTATKAKKCRFCGEPLREQQSLAVHLRHNCPAIKR